MLNLWASRAGCRLHMCCVVRRDVWRSKHKFFYDNDELSDRSNEKNEPIDTPETSDGDELRDFSTPQDLFQVKLKQMYASRPKFIQTALTRWKDSTASKEIEPLLQEKTYAAMSSFAEIDTINETETPVVGSIVQCISDLSSLQTSLGLVLRPALSKFNENYNKLVVLTLNNDIIHVNTQDVIFHCHGVIEAGWLESLRVLDQRDDEFLYSRSVLLSLLGHFNNKVLDYHQWLKKGSVLDVIYAKYAAQHNVSSVSLPQAVLDVNSSRVLMRNVNESHFNQTALLMALRLAMASRPHQYILPDLVPGYRTTNLVEETATNNLTKSPNYLLVSRKNNDDVITLQQFLGVGKTSQRQKLKFNFTYLLSQQTSDQSKSGLDLSQNIDGGEGSVKQLISILKLWLVYPHPTLAILLDKIPFLEDKSVNGVFNLLRKLKIYDDNEISDPFLSANMWSTSSSPLISYQSPAQLQPIVGNSIDNLESADRFEYLRHEKVFYKDNVIYGIPIGKNTVIGISLQKLNTRNFLINVHIPDLITRIKPASAVFKKMSKVSSFMSALRNLVNGESIDLFARRFVDYYTLDTNFESETPTVPKFDTAYYKARARPDDESRESKTCMTVSFTFNTHETNPFQTLNDKIQFSFDSITKVKVKRLTEEDLEEALKGNRASSLPFKLFRSKAVEEKKRLTNEDFHNVGFIFNVMKTHFNVRNINGSMNVDVTGPKPHDMSRISVKDSKITLQREERPLSAFFLEELDQFVGNITAAYCQERSIPVFTVGQELARVPENAVDTSRDEVIVQHDNLLLPDFSVTSFFQTLLSRDAKGYVSVAAYLIGTNFLSKPVRKVTATNNVEAGLKTGYVRMLDPLGSIECLLNQYQILSYKHLEYRDSVLLQLEPKPSHRTLAERVSSIKGDGYNINGPLRESVMTAFLPHLSNSDAVTKYLSSRMKRYWTLRFLEQKLQEQPQAENYVADSHTEYTAIVTLVGPVHSELAARISRAYVQELQIEVDVVTGPKRSLAIGSVVRCDKVVHLDFVAGECVLHESPVF